MPRFVSLVIAASASLSIFMPSSATAQSVSDQVSAAVIALGVDAQCRALTLEGRSYADTFLFAIMMHSASVDAQPYFDLRKSIKAQLEPIMQEGCAAAAQNSGARNAVNFINRQGDTLAITIAALPADCQGDPAVAAARGAASMTRLIPAGATAAQISEAKANTRTMAEPWSQACKTPFRKVAGAPDEFSRTPLYDLRNDYRDFANQPDGVIDLHSKYHWAARRRTNDQIPIAYTRDWAVTIKGQTYDYEMSLDSAGALRVSMPEAAAAHPIERLVIELPPKESETRGASRPSLDLHTLTPGRDPGTWHLDAAHFSKLLSDYGGQNDRPVIMRIDRPGSPSAYAGRRENDTRTGIMDLRPLSELLRWAKAEDFPVPK